MAIRIFWIDAPIKGRIAIMPRPMGGDRLHEDIDACRAEGVETILSLLEAHEVAELSLQDEGVACARSTIAFMSHPIPDRGVPLDAAAFDVIVVSLAREMAAGGRVAIHCRAGIGRSAVAAAAILVHCGLDAEDALNRIAAARGLRVPDTDEQRDYVLSYASLT